MKSLRLHKRKDGGLSMTLEKSIGSATKDMGSQRAKEDRGSSHGQKAKETSKEKGKEMSKEKEKPKGKEKERAREVMAKQVSCATIARSRDTPKKGALPSIQSLRGKEPTM